MDQTPATRALRAMLGDINLRFPRRPRLLPDLSIFEMPDGLGIQFRGAESPVILRGGVAGFALRSLMPMLDGTRTLDDLIELCPTELSHETLLRTLSLLFTKGLIGAGGSAERESQIRPASESLRVDGEILQRQLLFWGRKIGVTRGLESASQVQRLLETSKLILLGTGLFGAATFDILARSGCHDIQVLDWDDNDVITRAVAANPVAQPPSIHLLTNSTAEASSQLRALGDTADLIVVAARNAPAALFRAVNRISLERKCPWLRAHEDGTQIEVGPYVRPFESACYTCMELRESSARDFAVEEYLYQENLASPRRAGETLPRGEAVAVATLAASLVAGEVVRILTGIAAPTLLNAVLTVSPMSGSFETNRLLRVPRCPDCFRGAITPMVERER